MIGVDRYAGIWIMSDVKENIDFVISGRTTFFSANR